MGGEKAKHHNSRRYIQLLTLCSLVQEQYLNPTVSFTLPPEHYTFDARNEFEGNLKRKYI